MSVLMTLLLSKILFLRVEYKYGWCAGDSLYIEDFNLEPLQMSGSSFVLPDMDALRLNRSNSNPRQVLCLSLCLSICLCHCRRRRMSDIYFSVCLSVFLSVSPSVTVRIFMIKHIELPINKQILRKSIAIFYQDKGLK